MAEDNKTEQATQKRRSKAREQGQVARSRDLPGVAALAAVVGVVMLMAPSAVTHWTSLYRNILSAASGDLESNGPVLFWTALEVMRWLVPVLLAGMAVSALAGFAQGGINFAPEALSLKFDRFNPASKLGQLFSLTGLSNLMKSLFPFSLMLWIATSAIRTHWEVMTHASALGVRPFASFVGSMVLELTWKCGLVLLTWSMVDYFLTLKKMESDMKMTKQEVREEHKESDGNPLIKSRIRQLQRAMRRNQSLQAAATATVIVTNPTHYAIALRYSPELPAPTVVAKGKNLLAEKIKALARENGIMLVENKPLAQALYKSVEVGDSIPSSLYQAVAEILAVVYRAQADVRRSQAERRSKNASGQRIDNANGTTTSDGVTR